jgi:hypothetical protein|nr:MAG TPA: Peptidoglycan endopeptidase [Caudoviricetes sp.]
MTNNNPNPQQFQPRPQFIPQTPRQPMPRQQPMKKSGVPVWATVLCAVGMLLIGNLVGCGVGAGSSTPSEADVKASQTYKDLESKYKTAAKDSGSAKKDELAKLDKEISDAQAKLDQLTGQVNQAKKNTMGEGTWTVGTDIEAGTYKATKEVNSDCYWEITAGGSNGNDIVANDKSYWRLSADHRGGRPAGQDQWLPCGLPQDRMTAVDFTASAGVASWNAL